MVEAVIRWCLKNAFPDIIGMVGLLADCYQQSCQRRAKHGCFDGHCNF